MNREQLEALIQEQVVESIAQDAPKESVFMRLARRLPDMTGKQAKLPVLDLLPMANWVGGDTGAKAVSSQAWDDVYLNAAELAVIVPFPEAVLADTSFDVIGQVIPRIVESFGQRVDAAAIFGVNRPAEWQSDIVTMARNAGNGISGGVTYDTLMGPDGLIAKVEQAGSLVDGVVASIGARAALRAIKDGQGRPIYASDIKGSQTPYTLDGAPMFFPVNGSFDTGAASVIAGSFASAVYSIRQDVTIKVLDQATIIDPASGAVLYNLAQQDMLAIRAVMRMGWALPNPATRLDPDRMGVPFAYIEPDAGAAALATLTYTVKDALGPLSKALVDVGGIRKRTGGTGQAVFQLPAGFYTVRASKANYGVKNDSVTVSSPSAPVSREIVLTNIN